MKQTICITLEADVIEQAKAAAARDGRSVSNWIERALLKILTQR